MYKPLVIYKLQFKQSDMILIVNRILFMFYCLWTIREPNQPIYFIYLFAIYKINRYTLYSWDYKSYRPKKLNNFSIIFI